MGNDLAIEIRVDITNSYYLETTTQPHTHGFGNAHYGWYHLCKTDPEVGGPRDDKGTCPYHCCNGQCEER